MPSIPRTEGFRSDAMRAALEAAIAGRPAALEELLCRHGGGHDRPPNFRLAAAFGAEVASAAGDVARMLGLLGEDDAAPDTARVFLPVAAAFGWVARVREGRDERAAWSALAELAADERTPVRLGTREALASLAAEHAGAGALIREARGWLEDEDRERRFGAAAVVVELLGERQILAAAGEPEPILDYLAAAMDSVASAPRAAERSEARRRLLLGLPRTLAMVALHHAAGDVGPDWLEGICADARQPDLREALSAAIVRLGAKGRGEGGPMADRLRLALKGSAKPPRDPTRIRPGANRGRSSRRVR
jgi:hypothetical protein